MYPIRRIVAGFGAFVLLSTTASPVASFPKPWTRDPANPISTEFGGFVLFHDGIYKMWGGIDAFDYATSPDGRAWETHPASPVLVPGPGWYDVVEVANASVVIVDGFYHMWYSGIAADGDNRIAHATSPDGIVWTKDAANPVMDLGPPGSLDENELIHPFVIYENPLFRMWYNGVGGTPSEQRILYATSLDGVLWVRDPNPALVSGDPGNWDHGVYMMCVLPHQGTYYMFYTGGPQPDLQIGYATSPDGTNWVKPMPSEPVLGPGEAGAWDDLAVLRPIALATDTEVLMWYGGTRDFTNFSWGLATSAPVSIDPESWGSVKGRFRR